MVVALATVRDIVVGEELSIDYNPGHKNEDVRREHEQNERKVDCMCGAEACRKYIF